MSFEAALSDIVSRHEAMADRFAELLAYCSQRCPHPIWQQLSQLDYAEDVAAMQRWLERQLPIPDAVQVIWFAMWDETTAFDLRGSTSWSADPEDWGWWYEDDFSGGTYHSPVLQQMHALAGAVEDPEQPTSDDGVWELTDLCLTLGYVSLAAAEILDRISSDALLGARDELWAVSGHPDMVYGIILGRVMPTGFAPFHRDG